MFNYEIDEEQIIQWRRYIHRHPETAGFEENTAKFLIAELEKMGLEVRSGISQYGILATLKGDPNKKCAALRADMDALPITEETGLDFVSENEGNMHACGHDGHMSMVLGVAKALSENHTGGDVKFIFQPREELPPGGAKFMVEEGIMNGVDGVFGCHLSPAFPVGSIGIKEGIIMAVADDFHLQIRGKGGHGSSPNHTIDTIVVTSEVIVALQTIVSRMYSPMEPLVISIGTIHGGTAQNIIPDVVTMTGTLRCLGNDTRDKALTFMHKILSGVTDAWGATYELDYIYGYPPVRNDQVMVDIVVESTKEVMPEVEVKMMEHSLLAGEDFSYYGMNTQSVYFMVGTATEGKEYPWHHCKFDIDESALKNGATILAESISRFTAVDK